MNLEIREVKFGMSILSRVRPRALPEKSGMFRIISPVRKRKGTLSLWGLGVDGIEREYEWQRRNLPKEDQKLILSLQRGDLIDCTGNSEQLVNRARLKKVEDLSPKFVPRWKESI